MSNTIAVIVEGTTYEPIIVENLNNTFFNRIGIQLIPLPADQNIYMLWSVLKESDYAIDIIELIKESSPITKELLKNYNRDSFSEAYLFLDLDFHADNIPKNTNRNEIILDMLEVFNNETENGKLYISYPMAEAIGDYNADSCLSLTGRCYVKANYKGYKKEVISNCKYINIENYSSNDWKNIIGVYIRRLSCLFEDKAGLTIEACKEIDPIDIYRKQDCKSDSVIVLSAFPEFIIDYYKKDFLDDYLITYNVENCNN